MVHQDRQVIMAMKRIEVHGHALPMSTAELCVQAHRTPTTGEKTLTITQVVLIRESAEWSGSARGGGPPGPPPRRRYRNYDSPSDGESDEQPLRRPRRRRTERSQRSRASPPPEVIYRLPFTTWMNKSAKARKCTKQRCAMAELTLLQTLLQQ